MPETAAGILSGANLGEDRLREYVTETYKTEDRKILFLLKEHLSNPGFEDPDWQVTVLKGKVGVIVTRRPQRLRRILVVGLGGEKILFRKALRIGPREK